MNEVNLVGRIIEEPIYNEETKECSIVLGVPREQKNSMGVYETDFIPITVRSFIAETVKEYCRAGDTIGIKANIRVDNGKLEIMAYKTIFISSCRRF